jgi:hypothetical protein
MATTLNFDIYGLARRINRVITEIAKAASANSSRTNEFDLERVKTFSAALWTYHDHIVAQPQLDLPETHPTEIDVPDPELPDLVENESFNDMINMLDQARRELLNAQSSRDASGLNVFDSNRFTAILEKFDNFISNYVEVATPLDLPESSPKRAGVTEGRKGI